MAKYSDLPQYDGTPERRQAVNAALRELHDELERLDGSLGIARMSTTRLIIKRAMIAEFHKGEAAERSAAQYPDDLAAEEAMEAEHFTRG